LSVFHPEGPTLVELARQALSSTEHGYDLLASKFDHTPFRTPDDVIAATLDLVADPIDTAIDLCCGTGAALPFLRQRCRQRLVGVDFSHGMLAQARGLVGDSNRATPIELLRADVCDLPFEDVFDLAVCFGALGHFDGADESRFLGSVHRALAPGGRLVFPTIEQPPTWSKRNLLSRGFNAVMRVRNVVWRPAFVMYYLTFTLPEIVPTLEAHGFEVQIDDAQLGGQPFNVLTATKTS
jgi:ubiquinone/menaquinone biosynthesis C-methylase UbiE